MTEAIGPIIPTTIGNMVDRALMHAENLGDLPDARVAAADSDGTDVGRMRAIIAELDRRTDLTVIEEKMGMRKEGDKIGTFSLTIHPGYSSSVEVNEGGRTLSAYAGAFFPGMEAALDPVVVLVEDLGVGSITRRYIEYANPDCDECANIFDTADLTIRDELERDYEIEVILLTNERAAPLDLQPNVSISVSPLRIHVDQLGVDETKDYIKRAVEIAGTIVTTLLGYEPDYASDSSSE